MRRTKRIIFFMIFLMMIILPITRAQAVYINSNDYNPDNITTESKSLILVDATSGKILYSKNAFERMFPASTTKLMTAILTLEKCKLTDIATVSHNAVYSIPIGYTHANLVEGENLTIEQLLNVLLIPSANDAAIVLAEHIAGSVENFAVMMNDKAKELGCLDTHFVNPNGIHDENHYSTAYDLSLIGRYAMKFDDIMRIAKVAQYTLPKTNKYDKENRIFNATNGLINKNDEFFYEYATGLKTGYTDKSGSCIVATASKDNINLLEVVLGGESTSSRYRDCIKLFDYGFNNFSYKTLVNHGDIINSITVKGATNETKNLNIIAKNSINLLLKNNFDINTIEKNIQMNENIVAPIAKDSVVGTIQFEVNNETYSTELIAQNDVVESTFGLIVFRVLFIIIVFILFIIIISKLNKNNYKNNNYKKSKSSRSSDSDRGGRFKFTQISEFL